MNSEEAIKIFESVRSKYDVPSGAEMEFVEKRYIELPVDYTPESKIPLRDVLVWVGRYAFDISFWELALDMNGRIVRVEKSR